MIHYGALSCKVDCTNDFNRTWTWEKFAVKLPHWMQLIFTYPQTQHPFLYSNLSTPTLVPSHHWREGQENIPFQCSVGFQNVVSMLSCKQKSNLTCTPGSNMLERKTIMDTVQKMFGCFLYQNLEHNVGARMQPSVKHRKNSFFSVTPIQEKIANCMTLYR